MEWDKAQNYCSSALIYPSHLVEIFNFDQQYYLVQTIADYYYDYYEVRDWGIGLVNLGGGSLTRWIWSYSLQPPSFTAWIDSQTNEGFTVVMTSEVSDYDYDRGSSINYVAA